MKGLAKLGVEATMTDGATGQTYVIATGRLYIVTDGKLVRETSTR